MLQLENEYGSFDGGCDRNYTIFLRDLARRHFGDDVVLYTSNILMFIVSDENKRNAEKFTFIRAMFS